MHPTSREALITVAASGIRPPRHPEVPGLRHRGRISGSRQELAAAAASRSYTHSAQITKTFNAMISRDHIG